MKLIKDNSDELKVTDAWIDDDGDPAAIIGGVKCLLGTKETFIDAGVVWCQPHDAEIAQNWPMACLVEIDGVEQVWENLTSDPDLVAVARRYNTLQANGQATPGTDLLNTEN